MSLRARLIVAMAVVGIVLVFAAIAITRTTKTYLVGQLDDRLEETAGTSQRLAAWSGRSGWSATRRRSVQPVLHRPLLQR